MCPDSARNDTQAVPPDPSEVHHLGRGDDSVIIADLDVLTQLGSAMRCLQLRTPSTDPGRGFLTGLMDGSPFHWFICWGGCTGRGIGG